MCCDNCGSQYFKKMTESDAWGVTLTYHVCSECDKPKDHKAEFLVMDPEDQAVS